jgi:hypothetical protein
VRRANSRIARRRQPSASGPPSAQIVLACADGALRSQRDALAIQREAAALHAVHDQAQAAFGNIHAFVREVGQTSATIDQFATAIAEIGSSAHAAHALSSVTQTSVAAGDLTALIARSQQAAG